jgi:hypothetical protein
MLMSGFSELRCRTGSAPRPPLYMGGMSSRRQTRPRSFVQVRLRGSATRMSGPPDIVPVVSDQIRRLYDFELEPEVRDWLDSLSDSDFKRVDEVSSMLAERGSD